MKQLVIVLVLLWISGCASNSPSSTSAPVIEAAPAPAEETPIEKPKPAALDKVKAKLTELGYEGVGLELEDNEVLEFVYKVLSNPALKGRQVKVVYTGAALAYEDTAEELTIGGTRDLKAVLAFVRKKVPMRKKN